MLRFFKKRKAQSTAEYAILIALVVGVVIAMQTYVKRGVQARVHDEVGGMVNGTAELGTTDADKQYEPYYLNSTLAATTNAETTNISQTVKNPKKDTYSNVSQESTQTIANASGGTNY